MIAPVLYHAPNARSFRPLWMLEELQLDYRLEMVAFPPRVAQKSYLDLNPLGTLPLFVDGDVRMTESAAICAYLAARCGDGAFAVATDAPDYGAYLNALHFGEATLTFPLAIVLRYSRLEPEARRLAQVVDDYATWFLARLKGVETALARGEFMAGGRFTAADISVGYALMLAGMLKLEGQFPEATGAYWARLKARPGFLRAKAAQKAAPTSEKAS